MKVLFISDSQIERQSLKVILQDRCVLDCCPADESAMRQVNDHAPDVVVIDIGGGEDDSFGMLDKIRTGLHRPGIIALGAVADPDTVAQTVKRGADAYLTKPVTADRLQAKLSAVSRDRVLDPVSVVAENPEDGTQLIGESAVMRELRRKLRKLARVDAPVLLYGESGTGKELAARSIHRLSSRRSGVYLPCNCAAIQNGLFESEMFGVEHGAYTGSRTRAGYFEAAVGGTLFLDEVAELSNGVQAKLLRVIEEQIVVRLGSPRRRAADVRLVTASNRDLKMEADRGNFRHDLFYRLHVLSCRIPPLRERREDIPLLAGAFLSQLAGRIPFDSRPRRFSAAAMQKLEQHVWPGNVRELYNVIQRAIVSAEDHMVVPEDIEFA